MIVGVGGGSLAEYWGGGTERKRDGVVRENVPAADVTAPVLLARGLRLRVASVKLSPSAHLICGWAWENEVEEVTGRMGE